ncbi:MAG: phospholipase D-like domain-containing protein [Sphingobacteriales bacterium]
MKTTFLGQGFEPASINAVGHHLIGCLNSKEFHSFTGLSAFASEAGIFGLSKHIELAKKNFRNLTLVVGIDQEGTSEEALKEILNLNIDSYIFYQKESPIFHPKIYLFEGDNHIKLIIGSSNVTGRGLFTNVESSVLIEFDTDDQEGTTLLTELKSYYQSLFDLSDPNIFKISDATITYFVEKGIVPDEARRREIYNRKVTASKTSTTPLSADITIQRRATARISPLFLSKTRRSVPKTDLDERESTGFSGDTSAINLVPENQLVWKSGPLTERDLNIPKGTNTNVTGSMLLKKGQTTGIDQRHYFRDVVFASLPWASDFKPSTAHLERATAFFHFIIEGVDYGTFSLILTHNTKTDSKTYLQNNSMTSLSWGKAKNLIAKESLIGKNASLYKNTNSERNDYILIIE